MKKSAFIFLFLSFLFLTATAAQKVKHVFKQTLKSAGPTIGQPIRKPLFTLPPLPDRPNPPTPEQRKAAEELQSALAELRAAQNEYLKAAGFGAVTDMTPKEISDLAKRISKHLKAETPARKN